MRLEREARTGVERRNLVEGQRHAFCAVKGLNKSPLDAGDIEREAMTPAAKCGYAASHSGSFDPRLRSVNERLGCAAR